MIGGRSNKKSNCGPYKISNPTRKARSNKGSKRASYKMSGKSRKTRCNKGESRAPRGTRSVKRNNMAVVQHRSTRTKLSRARSKIVSPALLKALARSKIVRPALMKALARSKIVRPTLMKARPASSNSPIKYLHNSISSRRLKVGFKLNTRYPLLIDEKKLSNIKLISNSQDTGSGSTVYLLHNKKGEGYVLKISMVTKKKLYDNDNFPMTEVKMYKTMNILINKHITPHTFTIMDSMIVKREDAHADFKRTIRHDFGAIVMLNETAMKDDELFTLGALLDRKLLTNETLFLNIIFQVLYTLEAFNMINLKHNDLHLYNIFVIKYNKKNITPNSYYQYILADKTEVNLPNVGYSVRIFDYDRSCKTKSTKPFDYEIRPSSDAMVSLGQNCDLNHNFDTYKFIYGIRHFLPSFPKIQKLIESFFRKNSILLTKGKIKHEIYNKPIYGLRYGFLKKAVVENELISTKSMLKEIATQFKQPNGKKVSRYSLKYI